MDKQQAARPSLDLVEFVEQNILPRYNSFDAAHNLEHVTRVIRNALLLVPKTGADADMVYVVAAYHDLGMEGPRAVHHLTSGKILAKDVRLKRWFSDEKIRIMKEAVEDHRASASHEPRSIYGKIVAEADRDLDVSTVLRRTIQFGLSHYPEKSKEEQYERFRQHLLEKYSEHGYIRLWIQGSANETQLKELRKVIANEQQLRQRFEELMRSEERMRSEE